jgi:protein SCO1
MLRVLVVALVLLVAAIVWRPKPAPVTPPAAATLLPSTLALPDVALVDQAGRPFGLDALRGELTLLFFGFTHCPDVCPLTLKVLADARAELTTSAPRALPNIVFVSVDPNRDTPERIATYLANFDPRFIGVTAAEPALQPLLKALGVTVEKHDHGGDSYNVVHNSTVYVLGRQAELIAVSSGPHNPETLAADYLKIRQHYDAAHGSPQA